MSLEPIVRSEVSQRKTNIVYEHIYMESRKMVLMNLFAGQQWRYKHREQTCAHGWQWKGEGGMNGESIMKTYTLPYVK